MTRTFLVPAAALAAVLLAAAPALAAERTYSVADFDRVQVEGPFQVTLATGRTSSARASGSQAAIDRLTVEVIGGTIRIRANRSAWGGNPGANAGPIRIELATRDVRGAAILGAGSLAVDKVRGLRVELTVSGSGRLAVAQVDADTLLLALLGAGRISAAGAAKQVKATVQGSGDLDAAGLAADDLVLDAQTAGTIALSARRTAKVRANGSGNIAITGRASCDVTRLGAGEIRCGAAR